MVAERSVIMEDIYCKILIEDIRIENADMSNVNNV